MSDSVLLGRYTDRWLTGTANARRIAITGSIFAVVILFNVIRPFVASEPERAELRAELVRTDVEIKSIRQELAGLELFEDEVDTISKTIEEAAWNDLNTDLMRRFREGLIADAPEEGNSTIRKIAEQVIKTVVEPLSKAAAETGVPDDHAIAMRKAIVDWQDKYSNRNWWKSVGEKRRTLRELDSELGELQQVANDSVAQLRSDADGRRQALESKKVNLSARAIEAESEIDEALYAAVPVWAKNLISPEWMVKYFVWIVSAVAIYLVGTAWLASQDYSGMANASGWSRQERADPLYSSLWTLTWRGARGTAATLICYGAVLGLFWYCIGSSLRLLGHEQVAVELRPDLNKILLAHGLMAVALLAVIAIAIRGRRYADDVTAVSSGQR
ncbi:MAG: hypothetical protein HKO55_10505 [Gammaproteobacteria bacterium]|nr:hypothetical protein [Gammaproteobacteria bacterium]